MKSLFNNKNSRLFADVILPLSLPRVLTYGVTVDMQEKISVGMRVEVQLGRNKYYSGIVQSLHNEQPDNYEVKPIRNLLDKEPVVTQVQLKFWQWISEYYMAAPGEVMQAALPAHLKLSAETRLQWLSDGDGAYQWSENAYTVAEVLEQKKELKLSEVKAITGGESYSAVVNELIESGAVIIHDALEEVYKPKTEKIVTLSNGYKKDKQLNELFDILQRAPKQLNILMAYMELNVKYGSVKQKALLERANASQPQLKALAEKGIFYINEVPVDRLGIHVQKTKGSITFTEAQQKAYSELKNKLSNKNVTLLEGVTGSGKTMLYVEMIREVLASGKQALLLLPEIALTTQLVNKLYAYFGDELGVYHSRFSNNERVEIWEKVRNGKYKVVAGPRSAIWLPYDSLGVIIVDEEHDISYKQKDPAPRFNARDAAIYLATLHNSKVILGSATPSVESLYNTKNEKYGYIRLAERYMGVQMPLIEVINARSLESMRKQNVHMITPELHIAMQDVLKRNKQVILFQNRRGYTPFQVCMICGWVPYCKNCAVSLTYHKSTDKLHCHYCGLQSAVVHTCPSCGSNRLQSKTYGTEKLEEEVAQLFPDSRVARMDVDSMRGKNSFSELFEKLEKHKIDILIGTQMVVKGLDFAPVELVGVVSADSLLSYPDFRVNERAFQLMEQVSGRAGRTDGKGKVLIQAYNMQHPVLQWVKDHDLRSFYNHEINYRQQFGYPPFTRFIKIIFKHREEAKAIAVAGKLASAIKQTIQSIDIQGPAPALIARVRNLYIQEIWLKLPKDAGLIEETKAVLQQQKLELTSQKGFTSVQMHVDVDPY